MGFAPCCRPNDIKGRKKNRTPLKPNRRPPASPSTKKTQPNNPPTRSSPFYSPVQKQQQNANKGRAVGHHRFVFVCVCVERKTTHSFAPSLLLLLLTPLRSKQPASRLGDYNRADPPLSLSPNPPSPLFNPTLRLASLHWRMNTGKGKAMGVAWWVLCGSLGWL